MATLRSVQSGQWDLGAGNDSVDITLGTTLLDVTKAFSIVTCQMRDEPGFGQVTGKLINTTTLRVQRAVGSGAPAVTFTWYVAEFTAGVTVQRGSTLLDAPPANVSLSSIDRSKSFVLHAYRLGGSTYGTDDFVQARLTSSTNLELMAGTGSADGIVEWQVVTYTDCSVQRGDVIFTNADTSLTATIASVNTGKSFMLLSYYVEEPGTFDPSNVGERLWRGRLTSATQVTVDRGYGGVAGALHYEVVTFTDGSTTQRGNAAFASGSGTSNNAITAITTNRTLALATGLYLRGGRTDFYGDDNVGVGTARLVFTTTTNLYLERNAASAASDVTWNVIQFGGIVSLRSVVTGQSTVTPALSLVPKATLRGGASGTSSVTGAMLVTHRMAALVQGQSAVEGLLRVSHSLGGTVAATSAVTGNVRAFPSYPEVITWVDPLGRETLLTEPLDGPIHYMVLQGLQGRGLPPFSQIAERVPLQPGERLRQVRVDPREFELPLLVRAQSPSMLQHWLRPLQEAFDPRRGNGRLRVQAADGPLRELVCRYIAGLEGDESPGVSGLGHRQVLITLRAADPYWRDANATSLVYTAGEPAPFFPFLPLRLANPAIFAEAAVQNDGDADAWPEWIVTGPCTRVTLQNLTTGALLDLTTTLTNTQTLTIDTTRKTVKRNDGANLYAGLSNDSSLWPLVRGANLLRLEVAGSTAESAVQLTYRRRYLSC